MPEYLAVNDVENCRRTKRPDCFIKSLIFTCIAPKDEYIDFLNFSNSSQTISFNSEIAASPLPNEYEALGAERAYS